MVYTITASEKTNEKASDMETKALLYLMNFYKNRDSIEYFVIDFFNDVTGIHRLQDIGYDLQSKASKKIYPKSVGRFLITLFKNYLSELSFYDYILFVGGVSKKSLVIPNQKVFNINNFTLSAQKSIRKGLIEECEHKTYMSPFSDIDIDAFLEKITFVVDDKSRIDYIKSMVKNEHFVFKNQDDYFEKIFEEIRTAQCGKKQGAVEGIVIHKMCDFVKYHRHLSVGQIKLMVISRLLNKTSLIESTPSSFMEHAIKIHSNEIDRKDFIDDCRDQLFRTLYDKNNAQSYWKLFERVYNIVKSQDKSTQSLEEIFQNIPREDMINLPHLNKDSIFFFIALIKEGVQQ